jgi:hypothetical protein
MPAYQEWSKRKLEEGESPALIDNLDAVSMWCLPERVASIGEDDFEDMLADLKWTLDQHAQKRAAERRHRSEFGNR